MKVLFVGEESELVQAIKAFMQTTGGKVLIKNIEEALEIRDIMSVDMVIFSDKHFASCRRGLSLVEAIKRLRLLSNIPLMVLGQEETTTQQMLVNAWEAGADQYINCPPATFDEIVARMRALVRRWQWSYGGSKPIQVGDLYLNPYTREASFGGKKLHLTTTEFRLLLLLAENEGMVVPHADLMQIFSSADIRSVRKYISRLREFLGDDGRNPRRIVNVHNIGYKFIGGS